MSEKQPYEKHLAEKLRQLPPLEDVDHSWVQMRALLDRDMPRGGGFGSSGRGGRWWIAGIIVGILIIGTWFTSEQLMSKDHKNAAVAASQNNAANKEKETTPSSGVSLPTDSHQQKTTGNQPVTDNKATKDRAASLQNNVALNEIADNTTSKASVNPESKGIINKNNKNSDIANNSTLSLSREIKTKTDKSSNRKNGNTKIEKVMPSGVNAPLKVTRVDALQPSLVNENINYTGALSPIAAGLAAPYDPYNLTAAMTTQGKTGAAKARAARAARNQEDKTFAFGLSLPLAFPLGDQKALGYNSGAGANTVSDYLPAPHFQYYFNSRTFLQTELQVMSPQFIRPLLLYQNKKEIQPANYLYSSVYAQKLYYFNVPVSIYHSPFKNFYMGTGLQFSSMLSGVALYEERTGGAASPNYLVSEKYTRFKNDSLSDRLNTAEVRLLLEFNYNRNRFTVGLRYNQAFNNYASFQVNNTSPYTYDKNKALQFYLRYNIWQDKKSKVPAKPMLTLK